MKAPAVLTEMQREVLKEVGNIGAGHAATALSTLMNIKVGLTEPNVSMLPIDSAEVRAKFGHRDVAALHMLIHGSAPGEIVVLFDREESIAFVKRFLAQQIGAIEPEESLVDASLLEIANIIGGSYLTALINLIGADLMPSTPTLNYGPLDDVLSALTVSRDDPTERLEVFMIDNGFLNERGAINVRFLLVPDHGVLGPYLRAFGISES